MSTSPSGYPINYVVKTNRGDCLIGVGIEHTQGNVNRFLTQLQYQIQVQNWTQIARIDHNPVDPSGHDLYNEGLHVDVVRLNSPNQKIWPNHSPLPKGGKLITLCVNYLNQNANYFVGVYQGNQSIGTPPSWP